jgi:hypothetical protein
METSVNSTSMYRHVISARNNNKQTITPEERLHTVEEFVDKLEKAVIFQSRNIILMPNKCQRGIKN